MEEPIRLTVLKALTTHLEGIVHVAPDPENNVEGVDWGGFNLSGAVFRGRAVFGDNSPDTMLSILEAPRPDFPNYGGTNREAANETWQLLLQGWTVDDKLNPTDPAYHLMQVVELRLEQIIATKRGSGAPAYPSAYMLGNLISSFSFGPGVVRPPTEGVSSKAFFYMPLRVGLATVVGGGR